MPILIRGAMPTLHARRRLWRLAAALALSITSATAARAQSSDVTPPILVTMSFSPTIDVTSGPQTLGMDFTATDDLSGVLTIQVGLRGPTGSTATQAVNATRTSGTPLNGTWHANVVIPQFSPAGTWVITSVVVFDVTQNREILSTASLDALGFPTTFTVISIPDSQPPVIAGITITPGGVDVSSGPQNLTVDLHVTDDVSGAFFGRCVPSQGYTFALIFRGPTTPVIQNRYLSELDFTRVSGTVLDGVWRATLTMPQFSEPGPWRLQSLAVKDCAGNYRSLSEAQLVTAGLQISLPIISATPDLQPPVLTAVSYTPVSFNTSTANQTVTVRLGVADNLSGARFGPTLPSLSFFESGIEFRSPSGQQLRAASTFTAWTLESGTALNGVWRATIVFPQFSEEGTWQIDNITIRDVVRNVRTFTAAQLIGAGFPTTLDVIKPSLVTDQIIGSGGGTAVDQVFGNRARVTFPPGALPGNTAVAIDVLTTTPQIAMPQGYSLGAATNYVNIQLTPEPPFPVPAPGLTVTIPMTVQRPVGSTLQLWKINPTTGSLIPAVNVAGGAVMGTVNADQLSATFTGVASLSTVVGLIPDPIQIGLDVRAPGTTTVTVGQQLIVNTSATESEDPNAGPWRYVLEWGDETSFTATLTSLPTAARPVARGKAYAGPGFYTVKLTITDKNGVSSSRTLLITVNP